MTPTCRWLEYVDWADAILARPLRVENGHAIIPEPSGIGLDWNEEAVARYAIS